MLAKIEISRKSIEENLAKIKSINNNLICVLKDNAYGLGIKNIVPILAENQCYNYAVAYEEEAFEIREIFASRYGQKLEFLNILILSYIKEENLIKVVEKDFELSIFNMEQLRNYKKIFKKNHNKNETNKNKKVKLQIKFNIGMNRLGFDLGEITEIKTELDEMRRAGVEYEIKGVFAHVSDGGDPELAKDQIARFDEILERLDECGIKYGCRHVQASPLLFACGEKYNYDFARVGMALYGMEPLRQKIPLAQALSLKSRIISIREIKKGERISYGQENILEADKKIAVVAIGYAQGIQMQMGNNDFYVLVNGEKAKVLGEICMDMLLIDITSVKKVALNDEVVLIGRSGEKEITLVDMAKWTGSIQDDVLTKLSERIEREVV